MIHSIGLENFKCFQSIELYLGRLTLLTGQEGTGKSSVFHGVLALLQSDQSLLRLNGGLVSLGTAYDVIFGGNTANDISIRLDREVYRFHCDKGSHQEIPVAEATTALPPILSWQYLGSDRSRRWGGYSIGRDATLDAGRMGLHGEHVTLFLSRFGSNDVAPVLRHSKSNSTNLFDNTLAWLREINPNADIGHPFTPSPSSIRGSAYLSVIVACLAAKPETLLMIEHPETNLHPRGQSAMGRFLCQVAASGVQLVVTTHSDHLMNAVRLAVKHQQLAPAEVALHYLQRETLNNPMACSRVTSPRINIHGKLDCWPVGFFDEWDNALDLLLTK